MTAATWVWVVALSIALGFLGYGLAGLCGWLEKTPAVDVPYDWEAAGDFADTDGDWAMWEAEVTA